MSYLDELDKKKSDQLDEQKRIEQIRVVNDSGAKIVGAVEDSKQELSASLNNLLMATLVAKDPEIVKTAKNLANLSTQIDNATKNIKDSNFKPLADNLKTLQSTLKDIPSQIEQALEAKDPSAELKTIAEKIGQVKYDPDIKVNVSAPDVDFAPITSFLTKIEKAFKDFKVDIPKTDMAEVVDGLKDLKKTINGLTFPVPNYVLPFSKDGKATQVTLDSSGNVPISGTIDLDTTGLATESEQEAQTALLTTIESNQLPDGHNVTVDNPSIAVTGTFFQATQPVSGTVTANLGTIGSAATAAKQDTAQTALDAIKTAVETLDNTVSGSELQVDIASAIPAGNNNIGDVDIASSVLPSGASTSAKQDTIIGHLDGVEGILTTIDTDTGNIATNQTSGGQKTQIVDAGGEAATVTGGKLDVNATAELAGETLPVTGATEGVAVAIVDGDGDQITSFGGGTQYTEGDTDATPVGTIAMWFDDDNSDEIRSASRAHPFPVGGDMLGNMDNNITFMETNIGFIADAIATEDLPAWEGMSTMVAGVTRKDTPANTSDADGDIESLQMSAGRLWTSSKIDTALPAGNNNIGDVDIASSVLPSGASTSAKQDTVIGHLDGVETLLGTIDADTGGILTSVQTLDNAISGNEMQVDVVAALPAGDNNIGNVDLASSIPAGTNNIGDVDVLSLPAIPAGNNNIGDVDIASIAAGDNNIGNVDVVTLPALPAGTNAIGKLAANSGVDIGDVDVTSAVSATLDHGSNRDIDTSAEQITATSFACKFGVTVKADAANTGIVYVGNSDVTAGTTAATDGFPLSPGESVTLEVTNSNIPYAIASANNQVVYWIAV